MKNERDKYIYVFLFSAGLIALSIFLKNKATLNKDFFAYLIIFSIPALIIWGLIAWIISMQKKNKKDYSSKKEKSVEKKFSSNQKNTKDLSTNLKRLKKMHNDGHLTKVEFEKAKNKLLK